MKASAIRPQPVLLAIGFILLVGISPATVLLVDRASTDAHLLAETLDVQNKLSNMLLNVRRAESSQRGYLFTNNPSYLDEYHVSEPEAKKLISDLLGLTQSNAARQALLERARAIMDAKFAEMDQTIELNQSGRREAARAEVQGGRGREMMESLRDITDEAIEEESQLTAQRSERSRQTNNLLLIVTFVGAGLIVAVGAISIALVQRNARQAHNARSELASINANLERIVAHRTADLTEANEEIQRFAYIVSHDLRSPLVNIMGFTSELEELRKDIFTRVEELKKQLAALNPQVADADATSAEQLGQDFDEAIGFIKASIGKMDRLINAVLKLSREGRRQFAPDTIDMNALLQSIAGTVAHRAAELGASLSVENLPPVESDRLAVEQIFTNLVDNALKYGRPEEPLRIAVSGHATATQVVYEVKDNGRGIDPRDHQRVFELFRRAGAQDRPGEGIGLAHVRGLVRRLGGTMGLTSELGKGSNFTVTLPREWSVASRSAA